MIERCKYCGRPLDMVVDITPIEVGIMEEGESIFNSLKREGYRSIDLCNLHYTILQIYKAKKSKIGWLGHELEAHDY